MQKGEEGCIDTHTHICVDTRAAFEALWRGAQTSSQSGGEDSEQKENRLRRMEKNEKEPSWW